MRQRLIHGNRSDAARVQTFKRLLDILKAALRAIERLRGIAAAGLYQVMVRSFAGMPG